MTYDDTKPITSLADRSAIIGLLIDPAYTTCIYDPVRHVRTRFDSDHGLWTTYALPPHDGRPRIISLYRGRSAVLAIQAFKAYDPETEPAK